MLVVALSSAAVTSATLAAGIACSVSATAPAVCGEAMLVPLMMAEDASEAMPADKIEEPGAKMSTQGPMLLKELMASCWVELATAMAWGLEAGL